MHQPFYIAAQKCVPFQMMIDSSKIGLIHILHDHMDFLKKPAGMLYSRGHTKSTYFADPFLQLWNSSGYLS